MTGERHEDRLAEAYNRALALEKAGDLDAAAVAYREVLALDPEDRGGAALRLAAIGRGPVPDQAPPAYIATLFDQTAQNFEEILVERLGYAVPMMARDMLARLAPGPHARLLDLGCGTGLAGVALNDMATHLTGVDLSEAMLERADDKGVYDDLFIGDATGFLEADEPGMWDLMIATDVLPYMGALDGFFAAVALRLTSGGVFVFSSETAGGGTAADPDPAPFAIGRKPRYLHAEMQVRRALEAAGLRARAVEPITVRAEDGAPVPGHLYLAGHKL